MSVKNIAEYGEERLEKMREDYRREKMRLGNAEITRQSDAEFFARVR